jgi:hypothetical protein
MKRTGNLFDRIVERENFRLAVGKAVRDKRHRPDAGRFMARLDDNVKEMMDQVWAGTFRLGRFHQFVIHDPKERVITAPCFPERVLHHAIMNVCEPVFDRWLIDDTFACRLGRGRLPALQRAQRFARGHAYFLKLSVCAYHLGGVRSQGAASVAVRPLCRVAVLGLRQLRRCGLQGRAGGWQGRDRGSVADVGRRADGNFGVSQHLAQKKRPPGFPVTQRPSSSPATSGT